MESSGTETTGSTRPAPSMFSPHGHVLIEIARDKDVQIDQIADRLGLDESDVRQIVSDLIASGVTAQISVDQQPEFIIAPEPSVARGAIGPRSTRAIDRMYGRRP